MNNEDTSIETMLRHLPEYVKIAKTPDLYIPIFLDNMIEIEYEAVELKTIDLVQSFINLQKQAIKNIYENERGRKRAISIKKIKAMRYFQ